MTFNRIRELREDNDLTQQSLADMLHINRRTYSSYETGVNGVPINVIITLAKFYDVSLYYILDLIDEKKHFYE